MKIKELYSDSTKWTQFALARDKDGNKIYVDLIDRKDVCSFCLEGAILYCYRNSLERVEIRNRISEYILNNYYYRTALNYWNDDEKRTFEEVKKLVEDLDI